MFLLTPSQHKKRNSIFTCSVTICSVLVLLESWGIWKPNPHIQLGKSKGGLANGGLRYLSTIVHNCLRLSTFLQRNFPLERSPKGPQKRTIVDDCAQIAERGLKPPSESPHLDFLDTRRKDGPNRQSLVFSERSQLSQAIPQFYVKRVLRQSCDSNRSAMNAGPIRTKSCILEEI